MGNLIMDMINGFGYLLIPGFLALFMLLFRGVKPAQQEKVKADRCRIHKGSRYL
jgi:cytochrome bd-type quinol oxidase subunit 2